MDTNSLIIIGSVFVGVSGLLAAVMFLFKGDSDEAVEDRLEAFAQNKASRLAGDKGKKNSLLLQPLNPAGGAFEAFFQRFGNIQN